MQASSRCLGILLVVLTTACMQLPPKPVRSQLEIRQFQTRTYSRQNVSIVKMMKAVLNVLQDEGFLVQNADKDLGYIMASKEVDVQDQWETALSVVFQGDQARYQKNRIIACSVTVSEVGPDVKIRALFQAKLVDQQGGTLQVEQIENPLFYQEFFSKVDKGIYLEQQNF